mgnify:CR=1 FL=1
MLTKDGNFVDRIFGKITVSSRVLLDFIVQIIYNIYIINTFHVSAQVGERQTAGDVKTERGCMYEYDYHDRTTIWLWGP